MVRYVVHHTCGHAVTYNLIGSTRARIEAADKKAEKLCPECQAQKRAKKENAR